MKLPLIPAKDAKRVVVLGAGASAADGVPVQFHLFRKYAEIVQRDAKNLVHAASEGELRSLFALFWGANIEAPNLDQEKFPTFEEALGLLEMADSRGEFFKDFGGLQTEATRAQELRAHLTNLIAVVLDEATSTHPETHIRLITNLRDRDWINNTDFISLNYDLLIDNGSRTVLDVEPDYGVEFTSITDSLGEGPSTWKPRLFKVHGSLNWLYCPSCGVLDLFPGAKIVAQILREPRAMTCHRCGEPRAPIIIPPTFFKVMSNFYIQQTWKKAEAVLREADHLIFCGYSFPDADLHFKYMLKRAELNRADAPAPTRLPLSKAFPPKRRAEHLEVFVINEHQNKNPDARRAEQDRYFRFFREKPLVHWTKLSFVEFAQDPACYADPARWW